MQNEIDRFHLVEAVLCEIPRYQKSSQALIDWCHEILVKHKKYISEYGEDMPFIKDWKWND